MGVEQFITIFKQLSNEDTQYLMPHLPHVVESMCAIWPFILCLPPKLGLDTFHDLVKTILRHITFHPHVRILILHPNVICLAFKC
jgi:hypothetical protein